MLELKGLELRQGGFRLVADVQIDPKIRHAVIGPSGAGKSTLLMALAGFLAPHQGSLLWQGQNIGDNRPEQRPFSMLFQDNNLFPHMSIAQNVGLGIRPSLRLSHSEMARVSDALAAVGLDAMEKRTPQELSGGQQSRAALARVLVQKKPMILLDEPFAALGPALKAEMLDLVAALSEETGAGMLMVSHDPDDAERICQQTLLVAEGVVHAPQDTKALLANPPEALREYLGS